MQLTRDAWRFLLDESLSEFRNEVDKDMPMSTLMIFLRVPDTGTVSMSQIETGFKELSHAAVSRSVSLLTGQSKSRKDKGLHVCEAFDDPDDRRYRVVKLTPDGKKTRDKIHARVAEKFERFYNRKKD